MALTKTIARRIRSSDLLEQSTNTNAMATKHWKLELLKNGRHIVLFATTTDRMVERDLSGDIDRSLIQTGRQYHRRGQTLEQDHHDLAVAAFMTYAAESPYDLDFERIETASGVPDGLPTRYLEGPDQFPLVPVWEQENSESADQ